MCAAPSTMAAFHHGAAPRGARLHDAGQQPPSSGTWRRRRCRPGWQRARPSRAGRRATPTARPRRPHSCLSWPAAWAQRAVLAPARHAAIDQVRVEGLAGLGPKSQALHGAGPHAFDQRIGHRAPGPHQVTSFGRLEIGEHRALAARQRGAAEAAAGSALGAARWRSHRPPGPPDAWRKTAPGQCRQSPSTRTLSSTFMASPSKIGSVELQLAAGDQRAPALAVVCPPAG